MTGSTSRCIKGEVLGVVGLGSGVEIGPLRHILGLLRPAARSRCSDMTSGG